ncbi:hypothetical protein LO749_20770 [Paracoccus denitrificans]|uniref:hypothetical protein n=1 Tax=Paracoccus denitrificans TaxID=266 RepID=UPI001E4F29E9|nr:hypothetical protein [Paracoccus denitrificans]UFS66930.1 hypothetical protein LO749_20770 [Paracoccus denitrificans]
MRKITLAIPRGARIGPEAKPIYGYDVVEAFEERGLAVHKSLPGKRWRWMVTHVQSGLCLERIGAMTKKTAMENMRRALELPIDWTMSEQETIKALREDRRIMDGINAIAIHD